MLKSLMFAAGLVMLAAPAVAHKGSSSTAASAPLDVALGDVSLQKVPFLIAADTGIYRRNGLDVHHFITPGAARAAAEAGVIVPPENVGKEGQKTPVTVGGGAALVGAVSSGRVPWDETVIIATNENIVRDHVITRGDIRTEAELKGKKFGSSSRNVTGFAGLTYLEHAGLSKDVQVVDATTLSALKDGRADAVMATLFQVAKAPDQGLYDLVDVSKYHIPEPGSGVVVDRVWLKQHPDLAQRFLRAMIEGIHVMKADKAVFAATLKRWFNVTDPKMVDRLFVMAQGFPERPFPSHAGVAKAMQLFPGPGLKGLTPQSFYDDAPMQAVEHSLAK